MERLQSDMEEDGGGCVVDQLNSALADAGDYCDITAANLASDLEMDDGSCV